MQKMFLAVQRLEAQKQRIEVQQQWIAVAQQSLCLDFQRQRRQEQRHFIRSKDQSNYLSECLLAHSMGQAFPSPPPPYESSDDE